VLTQKQVEQFHRDGFINGGPCLTDDEVEELRAELERVIADRDDPDVPQPATLSDMADANAGTHIWWMLNIWMASPPYRRLLEHPKITEEIAQLTDAQELRVWHDAMWYKPAEQGGVTAWHQDAPLWPVLEPMTEVSAWVALDDVDEANGCMSMVPGSHLWGDYSAFLRDLPSLDGMPSSFEGHEVRVVRSPVRKGEVHYHHALTWHAAHANTSGRPRRAIAIHYMLEGTRYVASGEHVIKHLIDVPDGAPVEGENFPLCYQRMPVAS
jgi:phytanoyl-CoA hydroxylase